MYEDEYDLFSIKQFTDLFIIDDINCDDFLVYIPDNIMNDLLDLCNDFEIYITMLDSNNELKIFDIMIVNYLSNQDVLNSTTLVDKSKLLPFDINIKIKLYFKTLKQKANFKIKYTGY